MEDTFDPLIWGLRNSDFSCQNSEHGIQAADRRKTEVVGGRTSILWDLRA